MHPFKKFLGRVYFFWGLIVFLVTMLPVVPIAALALCFKEPARQKIIHPAYKIWISIFLPLAFIRLKRVGKAHFSGEQNYVVVINHNSFVDIPVATPWIPGPNKTLAKVELSRIPVFGIVYKAGSILVDRGDAGSKMSSFSKMVDTLKQGIHLALYPEGTRNKTAKPLQKFYDGAFVTAIRARKPVMPCVLFGTRKILPADGLKCWAWPHNIQIHFLPPVSTEGYTLRQRDELMDKVHRIMEDYIIAHNQLND